MTTADFINIVVESLGSVGGAFRSLRRPWHDSLNKHKISNFIQRLHCNGDYMLNTHFWWLRVQWMQLRWRQSALVILVDPLGSIILGGERYGGPLTMQCWHKPFVWGCTSHISCLSRQLVQQWMGRGVPNIAGLVWGGSFDGDSSIGCVTTDQSQNIIIGLKKCQRCTS